MYLRHFGFSQPPFGGPVSAQALYLCPQHREAMAALLHTVAGERGVFVLTGAPGVGKTTLCRALAEATLPRLEVAWIEHPPADTRTLFARAVEALGFAVDDANPSLGELAEQLNAAQRLARHHERSVAVVIDDADGLDEQVLHDIGRCLQSGRIKGVRFVLVGGPSLPARLGAPGLRVLRQRVAAEFSLAPLGREHVEGYVHHRLQRAGGERDLFSRGALWLVHRHGRGLPRRIDALCERALTEAFLLDRESVDARAVRTAARATEAGVPSVAIPGWARAAAVVGVAIAGTATLALGWSRLAAPPMETLAAAATAPTAPGAPVAEVRPVAAPDTAQPAPPATPARPAAGAGPRPTNPFSLPGLAGARATSREAAAARLLARWRVAAGDDGAPLCERARAAGLACLEGNAGWDRLARLDRPALLTLWADEDTTFHAVLSALEGDVATLDIGGDELNYARAEVARYWHGEYLALWRPPVAGVTVIRAGAPAAAVAWLRTSLGTALGESLEGPARFDERLRSAVRRFQRQVGLTADGIAGPATLVALTNAIGSPEAPRLKRELRIADTGRW